MVDVRLGARIGDATLDVALRWVYRRARAVCWRQRRFFVRHARRTIAPSHPNLLLCPIGWFLFLYLLPPPPAYIFSSSRLPFRSVQPATCIPPWRFTTTIPTGPSQPEWILQLRLTFPTIPFAAPSPHYCTRLPHFTTPPRGCALTLAPASRSTLTFRPP